MPRRMPAVLITGCVVLCTTIAAQDRSQVPAQDRPAKDAALRPPVMGPSGGVSTGHPLTTAAAFSILLKGGNAFDAGDAAYEKDDRRIWYAI